MAKNLVRGKPFEEGHIKHGGRKKGTPNKSTLLFNDILEKFVRSDGSIGYDPVTENLKVADICVELALNVEPEKSAAFLSIAANINIKAANKLYPDRKAIEITGDAGGPINIDVYDSAAAKVQALLENAVDAEYEEVQEVQEDNENNEVTT